MSEFIFKDLFFVSWTAFMAMELTGYAVKNSEKVYIEPIDYMPELCRAIETLDTSGLEVSIYNIPNCLIPEGFRRFAAQNILIFATIVAKKHIAADCSQPQNKFSKD